MTHRENKKLLVCVWNVEAKLLTLQGDFIVPSSREAVANNNPWNEELRGRLPQLFSRALLFFKALPAEDSLLWVNRWLQCIPLHGEVSSCTSNVLSFKL